MIQRFTPLLLPAGLMALLLAACTKPNHGPAPGTIDGQLPAYKVARVTATDAANQPTITTPYVDTAGYTRYTIDNLAPGTYTLTFEPESCFNPPAPQTVTVASNQTTEPAKPTLTNRGGTGTFIEQYPFWNPFWCIQGMLQADNLTINLTTVKDRGTTVLTIKNVALSPGTYPLGPSYDKVNLLVTHVSRNNNVAQYSSVAPLSEGEVVITAIQDNPRRISGTYWCRTSPITSNSSFGFLMASGNFNNVTY